MTRQRIFILIFIFVHLRDSSCLMTSLHDTGEKIGELYLMIDKIKFNTSAAFEGLFIIDSGSNEGIKKQLNDIYERLDRVGEPIDFAVTRASFKPLPSYINLFRDLDRVEIFVQTVDEYYEEFHSYMTGKKRYFNETFQDLAQRINSDVQGIIQVLRKAMADYEELSVVRESLVSSIGDYATNQREEMCNGPQMISSILVQLFETVMLAEMKSNLMLSLVNIYKYIEQTDIWKWMNLFSWTQFKRQFGIYVMLFTTNLIESDLSYIRACDPENGAWTRNDAFYELERTVQATIFRYYWPSCQFLSCNEVWSIKGKCEAKYHNRRSFCPHDLVECAYLKTIQACQLKRGLHKFQYVNSTELGFLGKNSECPKDKAEMIKDGSGANFTYSACACNCYQNHNKVSLAIIQSNVKENMAIIGIRFLRRDKILYIQPKEGKLSHDGRIIRYSERWVSVQQNIAGSDIYTVDKMNRVFFLDDLHLPWGYILTGVKFSKVKRGNVEGIAIGIFGLPFDYKSGKINNDERLRIFKQAQNANLGKPLSFTAVSSIYTNLTHIVSPGDMKYVSLERSTLKDDFGQSTLPLFDIIPIKPHPPSPLGGIGMFHKGVKGHAGFIALRVYGINYAAYFVKFESDHLEDGIVKFNHSNDN